MTAQTTPTPAAEERPVWQRYLPAGAAATVVVAAIIGLQAASSDGSTAQSGPQGGPPGMIGPGQQNQGPPAGPGANQTPPAAQGGTQDGTPQDGQVPPWDQDGAGPPGVAPGQGAPGGQQQAPADGSQGLASPRTSVS